MDTFYFRAYVEMKILKNCLNKNYCKIILSVICNTLLLIFFYALKHYLYDIVGVISFALIFIMDIIFPHYIIIAEALKGTLF